MPQPRSVLSRELLPASIAVFSTAALASFQALGIEAALPDIAAELGNLSLLPWVITAYLLTSSLATVVTGPFIDSVGLSRVFRLAVITFSLTGLATAFSPSMEVLVGLRLLQGVGAGLILTTGTSATSLIYPQHLVGRAFAANATVWGVMGVAGPALAAFILTFLSWEWIFYLNVPLGALALFAGWRVMPGPFGETKARFDPRGAVMLAAVTVGTLLAVDSLSLRSLAWLAAAGVALFAYVRYARHREHPVVRLTHIVPQPYRGLALATGLQLAGTIAMSTYVPLYVRAGLEGSPALTAWSVLPLTTGWTTGALISSRMADRHSESWVMLVGFMVGTPGLAASWAAVNFDLPVLVAFFCFMVAGIGVGMNTNAALTLLRSVTDASQMGRVASAHLFARNQGFTFGAALGGAVLLFVVTSQLGDLALVRELIAAPAGGGPPRAAEAVQFGFAVTVAVGFVLALLGWIAAIGMRRSLTEARMAKRGPAAAG